MKKFILAALASFALLSFVPAPNPVGAQTKTASNFRPSDLLAKPDRLVLSDLQQAQAIAHAGNDTVAHACYVALIGLAQQMQTVASGSTTGAPGDVTKFQRERLRVLAQHSNSPVSIACAALQAQIDQP